MASPIPGVALRSRTPEAAAPAPVTLLDLLDHRFVRDDLETFAVQVVDRAAAHQPQIAVGVNAHLVNQAAGDVSFSQDLRGVDVLYADGQSVVWSARVLGVPVAERIATTDLAPVVVRLAAQRGLRLYLLGGEPGVADAAADRLRRDHPDALIRTHHGYFSADDEQEILRGIREWGAEIVFVGMGDPRQLRWATEHRAALGPATVLTSGGLFDWLSGRNARAPRWMIRAGLEWLWRLGIEPKRLWRRYVIGNPAFVARVAAAYVRRRRAGTATTAAEQPQELAQPRSRG